MPGAIYEVVSVSAKRIIFEYSQKYLKKINTGLLYVRASMKVKTFLKTHALHILESCHPHLGVDW